MEDQRQAAGNEDNMKEYLAQIRGQQAALTLLIQGLQMQSLTDITRLLQQNSAVLNRVADDTRSLRATNPKLNVAESIFSGRRAPDSIFGDVADTTSTIDGREFEFDDIIVNSKAYRRALVAAQQKVSQRSPDPERTETRGGRDVYGISEAERSMGSLQLSPKYVADGGEPSDRRAVTPTFNVRRKDVPKTLVEASAQLRSHTRSSPDSPSSTYHEKTEALPEIRVTPVGLEIYELPSSFPKLPDPVSPNVPLTHEEKGRVIERARELVLYSVDPDMQLAWASDALNWLLVCYSRERNVCDTKNSSFQSSVEGSQLEIDAKNIIDFLVAQGHPHANFEKGKWLEFGHFGHRVNKRSAFHLYRDALSEGYMRAAYRMGMMYESSNDPTKAIEYYERGRKENDAACCYRLAMIAFLGQHDQKVDFAKAIPLIKTAAQRADEYAPQAAYVLGLLQADDLPHFRTPELKDLASARKNIEKAAYLGFAKAQLKMGSAYELCTLGCPFDPALSMHYLELASLQGEPEADMSLSRWFLVGYEGVFEANKEIAFTRAKRAADQDLPTALFAVGYFYEIGVHVDVDIYQAVEWYSKAANAGNLDATARVRALIQQGYHPPRVPGPGPRSRSTSPLHP